MTDLNKFNKRFDDACLSNRAVAKYLSITQKTLINKRRGTTEFTPQEMFLLSKLMHFSTADNNEIFFADSVSDSITQEPSVNAVS